MDSVVLGVEVGEHDEGTRDDVEQNPAEVFNRGGEETLWLLLLTPPLEDLLLRIL